MVNEKKIENVCYTAEKNVVLSFAITYYLINVPIKLNTNVTPNNLHHY